MDIEGLSAIVTGAGSGLGLATAQALSKAGARVTLLDLDEVRVKNAAAEIGALGIGCDVINSSAVEAALDLAEDRSGPIRIVVNCAGIPGGMRLVGRDGQLPFAAGSTQISSMTV